MDMDGLLTASVLDDIGARHWARYKMTWPPEIAPAGTLISRIVRELEKRTLSVRMVLKVRTQAHQQRDVRKRTRVAEGLEMVSAAVDRDAAPSLHNYMTNLMTLLVAYSKAGSKLRADAPTAEPKTVDSTRVVECPLDVGCAHALLLSSAGSRPLTPVPHGAGLGSAQGRGRADGLGRPFPQLHGHPG